MTTRWHRHYRKEPFIRDWYQLMISMLHWFPMGENVCLLLVLNQYMSTLHTYLMYCTYQKSLFNVDYWANKFTADSKKRRLLVILKNEMPLNFVYNNMNQHKSFLKYWQNQRVAMQSQVLLLVKTSPFWWQLGSLTI